MFGNAYFGSKQMQMFSLLLAVLILMNLYKNKLVMKTQSHIKLAGYPAQDPVNRTTANGSTVVRLQLSTNYLFTQRITKLLYAKSSGTILLVAEEIN